MLELKQLGKNTGYNIIQSGEIVANVNELSQSFIYGSRKSVKVFKPVRTRRSKDTGY